LTGLVGDPGGVAGEIELVDQLPAPRRVLPARGRVRADLRLAVADRHRLDAAAALPDVLVDAVSLAGDEPLRGLPRLEVSRGEVGTVLAHRRGRLHEQVALRRQRHAERIDRAVVGPRSGDGGGGREGRRGAGHERAGGSDLRRLPPGPPGGVGRQLGEGEEPPAGPDEGAHAEAGVVVLGHVLDLAVARFHALVAPVHHAGIGVAGAAVERSLHGRRRDIELGHRRDATEVAPRLVTD
jgi:hypothetical protein